MSFLGLVYCSFFFEQLQRDERERERAWEASERGEKKISSPKNFASPPFTSLFHPAGATSTVLEAEDLTSGERRALKVGILWGLVGWERGMCLSLLFARRRRKAATTLSLELLEQTADDKRQLAPSFFFAGLRARSELTAPL